MHDVTNNLAPLNISSLLTTFSESPTGLGVLSWTKLKTLFRQGLNLNKILYNCFYTYLNIPGWIIQKKKNFKKWETRYGTAYHLQFENVQTTLKT